MSSANYVIPSDTVSVGGDASSSSSFSAQDTLGEGLSGENMNSATYLSCVGFQCGASAAPYISFSVSTGMSSPGTEGGSVSFGTLDGFAVRTSGDDTVNSVFITAETNAAGGAVLSVKDTHGGLASESAPADKISSQNATLSAGSAGYGVCIFAASQRVGSPATFDKAAPYNGACGKSSGHEVGAVGTTPVSLLTTSGALQQGTAEVLVKAAVSRTTPAHNDYADELTFIFSAAY